MCEREGERNFCNERLRRGKRKEERERYIYIVRIIQKKRDIQWGWYREREGKEQKVTKRKKEIEKKRDAERVG